jgi:FMN phosphatase YigB (HAD superfamily)
MDGIDWSRIRLVIFDLDGTLYDQGCIRRRMLLELGQHSLRGPSALWVLRVVTAYRRVREQLAEEGAEDIGRLQYERSAAALGIEPGSVVAVVGDWVEKRPLRHLGRCRFAAVDELFDRLRSSGRQIGVFSDYPVGEKLLALQLTSDFMASAADPGIDRLKPHPAGLKHLMSQAGVAPSESLMIGDREDRDGACARAAGVPCLIKTRWPRAQHHFSSYRELLRPPLAPLAVE